MASLSWPCLVSDCPGLPRIAQIAPFWPISFIKKDLSRLRAASSITNQGPVAILLHSFSNLSSFITTTPRLSLFPLAWPVQRWWTTPQQRHDMSSSMANQPLPASSNSGLPIHHPATKASDHPGQRCKTSSSKLNSKPTSGEAITIILLQKLPLEGIRQPRQTRLPLHNQPLGHHFSRKRSIELAAIAISHRASPLAAKSIE